MTDEIKVGTVLIKEGTRLPARLRLESDTFSNGWRVIKKLDGRGFSRKISEQGWACVHVAEEIRTTALGFDTRRTVRRATHRSFAKRKSARFSCLEITQVTIERIFGLVYVMVAARPRLILEELGQLPSGNLTDWHQAKLAGV